MRAAGYRLGILSNCSVQAGAVIEDSPIAALTDALLLSFRLGIAKPSPTIYTRLVMPSTWHPSTTAFVADGAFGELDGAAAVGMTTVRIEQPNQSGAFGTSEHWDYLVRSLAEVPPLLQRLSDEPRAAGDGTPRVRPAETK